MTQPKSVDLETDPRFPSGPWVGFFLQKEMPGRHMMDLDLTFHKGVLEGEGRDIVGQFIFRGRYEITDGKCHWTKKYLRMHDVFYKGFNEGKGIWGTWEIPPFYKGGFHIWPKGMEDPTGEHLTEKADLPAFVEETLDTSAPVPVPGGVK